MLYSILIAIQHTIVNINPINTRLLFRAYILFTIRTPEASKLIDIRLINAEAVPLGSLVENNISLYSAPVISPRPKK